tara:strand:- start:1077 stop:2279 length:1203 start_codon:yes stop_codon:yes gene_type:complete
MKKGRIDPIKRALELRKTLIEGDKVLVTDFSDTLQGKDTSRVIDLMPNVATGEYVFRTKVNVKAIDPIAAEEYGVEFFDVRDKNPIETEAFIKRGEFDFPLWFKHHPDFKIGKAMDYNLPFIIQVAGCNFHNGTETGGCWYCFVDDKSNDGIPGKGKSLLGSAETVDSMLAAREKIKNTYKKLGHDLEIRVLRTSGGEPTIALDWVLNTWREIGERGLDFVGQIDSNLSTGQVVDDFERQGIYEPHTLEKLAEYPIKVLTALKGVDEENLQSNVQSTATMETQLYSLKKFLKAGFDIYPQMYNPNPKTLAKYLERIEGEIPNLPLRIHIGPLKLYGPNKARLTAEAQRLGVDPEKLIAEKQTEWNNNYQNSCEVMEAYLKTVHGVGYKDIVRSDVELTVK